MRKTLLTNFPGEKATVDLASCFAFSAHEPVQFLSFLEGRKSKVLHSHKKKKALLHTLHSCR